MKEWAAEFYSSDAWKQTRRAYRKSVGGLCERCRDRGEIRAGEIVHHIRHLTPEESDERIITDQLFRIKNVTIDTEKMELNLYAEHVSYDLAAILIRDVKMAQVSPALAINRVVDGLMMAYRGQIATNLTTDENGTYTSKEDVALYIYTYGKLPSNFITKNEAKALGWSGGSLEEYAPGMCIGGDRFGNYEGILPQADGRTYTECDIDTLGASKRGAKRIVFSNDGLIYYTEDHYETFELLYGEE